jgi:O-antigen/teichoic acid export membrane protein
LGGAVLVVYQGYGILEIVQVSLVANVCCLLVQAIVVYTYTPVREILPRFHLADMVTIFRTNGWYWLQSVIALVGFLSDRLIIGYLTDLKTVGYYSIAALIGSQIHNILLAFGSFVFPKVAAYNMLNKSTKNVYYLSRFLIAVSGWVIIIFLLLSGDLIFKWWLGETTYLHAIVYIKLYLAFSAVILLIIIPYHFINGSASVKLNSLFEAILRSAHIAGMILAYHFYGMTGLLWALILITLVNIPMQYLLFHKTILGIREVKEAFLPVLPAVVIIFIAVSPLWAGLILTVVFAWLVKVIYYDKTSGFATQLIRKKID